LSDEVRRKVRKSVFPTLASKRGFTTEEKNEMLKAAYISALRNIIK